MSLRTMLHFRREPPGTWQCFVCHRWTDRDECPNHRFRVFREPVGPRPSPPPPPPYVPRGVR